MRGGVRIPNNTYVPVGMKVHAGYVLHVLKSPTFICPEYQVNKLIKGSFSYAAKSFPNSWTKPR